VQFAKGTINEIGSVEEFDRLIEDAGDDNLAVVEFYAKWCRKCISMVKRFVKVFEEEPLAAKRRSERVQF